MTMNEISAAMMRERMGLIETKLRASILTLEGRMPSNEEVVLHGQCGIWPDGTAEYKWKGFTILKVSPLP